MKICNSCGSSTTTITRFGNAGMFCGNCLRNGKKLSRARVDAYLVEKGMVAVPKSLLSKMADHKDFNEVWNLSQVTDQGFVIETVKGES